MDRKKPSEDVSAVTQDILGHLNFSSGSPDPRFLANLNKLFGWLVGGLPANEPAWRALGKLLQAELRAVRGTSEAFQQIEQGEAVLGLVFDAVLPAYRQFHSDLLFHQTEESLFQPFFIGRVCEAVLRQGAPWDETERIVADALDDLNDYIGHRPVAVLRTEQKLQPYEHEWVRPISLWIRGAGAAVGPYRELVETALSILDTTDPMLRFDAMFAMEQLDELAFDPRAYDFDHPVNKRPNYLFGQWDMNQLDNAGRCRRFVLQQVTLDAMLDRLEHRGPLPRKQVLFEEAAVLAGTMLMGSGVSGDRPDSHDSSVTLATLLQKIAIYRDVFYEQLLRNLTGTHAERLRAEAVALRQPFGGARQHFNHFLSRRRALQLQHVHLAQLFAAIGYPAAAARQSAVVPVASARMACEMRCRMAAAHLAIDRGELAQAAAQLPPIENLLRRAIECGAMVDPWNILGFGGQYSLFPAVENSVYDHRVDELLDSMSDIFMLYVQIHKAAAAAGDVGLQEVLSRSLGELARWWDQFASVEVGSIEGISGRATLESAESVAAALRAWHEGGAAAGDLAFWRRNAEHFSSPKAYALVIETLLDHRDPVAAMALLVQWLSQAEEIPLVEEDYSFHDLAMLWMEDLWSDDRPEETKSVRSAGVPPGSAGVSPANKNQNAGETPALRGKTPVVRPRWPLARKFLDYLESNAEDYWQVPHFEMAAEALGNAVEPADEFDRDFDDEFDDGFDEEGDEEEEADEDAGLFGAAYEDVTYRDSADDGIEGEMFETGENPTDIELVGEAERIVSRLGFLTTVAQLWKLCATASSPAEAADRDDVLAGWLDQAEQNQRQLSELLASVHRHRIPSPHGTQESLMEYDRRRSVKETLMEEIIQTSVETADAARMIRASMARPAPAAGQQEWEQSVDKCLAAIVRGDAAVVQRAWPELLRVLADQPLLYVAIAKGGNPQRIIAARTIQYILRRLLGCLPRLGLLTETCRLLETAQTMETRHPVGPGGVTEFDRVFEIACRAITECLVISSAGWEVKRKGKEPAGQGGPESMVRPSLPVAPSRRADTVLIDYLEQVTEVLLRCWLGHSRGVRLSVLEPVSDSQRWRQLKQFIETYGGDLFTQQFMNFGNLRGILHQGVAEYLKTLREQPESEEAFHLLADIDVAIPLDEAAHWLGTAIEAVVENYGEYVDYNSITTQSDRGEMLYTLLDFLRLRASYDRLAWNLRPVAIAHETLVRCGRDGAAETWRRAVAERTSAMANQHQKRFDRLCEMYGMRLPSIAEHLAERFIRPLEIDRLCSLIRPAIEELRQGRPPAAVEELEQQIARFTQETLGAGFELPSWLEALEDEVEHVQWQGPEADDETLDPHIRIPQVRLSRAEVEQQVRQMLAEGTPWTFEE
jgi:hypothetical protein